MPKNDGKRAWVRTGYEAEPGLGLGAFQRLSSNPARARFAAIREPMIPRPRKANRSRTTDVMASFRVLPPPRPPRSVAVVRPPCVPADLIHRRKVLVRVLPGSD
jgi:hypothetical protein